MFNGRDAPEKKIYDFGLSKITLIKPIFLKLHLFAIKIFTLNQHGSLHVINLYYYGR